MSYIYIGVTEQKVRDLIDQLPVDQHTLDKYVEIGELQETSKANAQASNQWMVIQHLSMP